MINELIKWKPLLIGVCIVIILYLVSDLFSGVSLLLPSMLLAGIYIGVMIKGDIKIRALNGAVLGLISGLIVTLILIAMISAQGYNAYLTTILNAYVVYIVVGIILSAVGGVFGSLIKTEYSKNAN
ncbi:MAG: DUF5518 domain-containing protein [Methanobacteriaceae archaeon]|jgi:hypothetical protein|nr:MAG: hypothetical protein CIT01_04945 [Methanobacterium sp. BRmetb2]MCC7557815.1 DUF5518 domain-containing protein [Methanobacteriaceae archaeon]